MEKRFLFFFPKNPFEIRSGYKLVFESVCKLRVTLFHFDVAYKGVSRNISSNILVIFYNKFNITGRP